MFRSLAALLLAICALTACGSTAPPAQEAKAGGAFPVTITHKFGQTTIKAEPKRIVTVGLSDQDSVLALGKVPVGTTEWFGDFPGAIGPWAKAKLGGAALPTVLKDPGTGPQVEKIAALRPDLILALYAGLTKEQYATLSKFAPVVAAPAGYSDYGIPWQEQTKLIGQALGEQAGAAALIKGVDDRFAQAREEHPELAGKTGVVATPYQGIWVYGTQDPRSRTLASLGMRIPAELDSVIKDKFGANISKERTDLLDQDAVVWIVMDPAKDPAKLHADPVYKDLGVAKARKEVFLHESSEIGHAFSFVTPLSLPYVIEKLAPQLGAAVKAS